MREAKMSPSAKTEPQTGLQVHKPR